jgi:hypothetical protein
VSIPRYGTGVSVLFLEDAHVKLAPYLKGRCHGSCHARGATWYLRIPKRMVLDGRSAPEELASTFSKCLREGGIIPSSIVIPTDPIACDKYTFESVSRLEILLFY